MRLSRDRTKQQRSSPARLSWPWQGNVTVTRSSKEAASNSVCLFVTLQGGRDYLEFKQGSCGINGPTRFIETRQRDVLEIDQGGRGISSEACLFRTRRWDSTCVKIEQGGSGDNNSSTRFSGTWRGGRGCAES
jgi:hypothetical protein